MCNGSVTSGIGIRATPGPDSANSRSAGIPELCARPQDISTKSLWRRNTTSGNTPPSLADRSAWRFHHACQLRSHSDARSSSISIVAGGKRVSLSAAQAAALWLLAGRRSSRNNGFQFCANHSIRGSTYQCTESTSSPATTWEQRLWPSVQIWKPPHERPTSGSMPCPPSGSAANSIWIAKRLVLPASLCQCVVTNSPSPNTAECPTCAPDVPGATCAAGSPAPSPSRQDSHAIRQARAVGRSMHDRPRPHSVFARQIHSSIAGLLQFVGRCHADKAYLYVQAATVRDASDSTRNASERWYSHRSPDGVAHTHSLRPLQ